MRPDVDKVREWPNCQNWQEDPKKQFPSTGSPSWTEPSDPDLLHEGCKAGIGAH
jgi:hypothetical protein